MQDGEWHYMTVEDKEEHSQLALDVKPPRRKQHHCSRGKGGGGLYRGRGASLRSSGGSRVELRVPSN